MSGPLFEFSITFLMGGGCGAVHSALKLLPFLRKKRLFNAVFDAVFLLICGILTVFLSVFCSFQGVRWYLFAAFFTGFVLFEKNFVIILDFLKKRLYNNGTKKKRRRNNA